MRRRNLIILVGALVLTGVVILCLRLGGSAGKSDFFLDYSSLRSGHLGNVYSQRFIVATLTNRTPVPILFKNLAVMWNGKDYTISVPAGDSVALPVEIQKDVVRFRITFDHERKAGPLPTSVSRIMRKVGPNALPQGLYRWLSRNGWIDGLCRRRYVGPWISTDSILSALSGKTSNETTR